MYTKMPRIKNTPYPLFQKSGSILICVTSVGMGFTLNFSPSPLREVDQLQIGINRRM